MSIRRYLPTDAGVLIALLDPEETKHSACWRVVNQNTISPLLTTWLCFSEALYWLGEKSGRTAQMGLWQFRRSGGVRLYTPEENDATRCDALMEKYTFADFADASLIVLCENINAQTVFTLDSHFYAYRLADGTALRVLPELS